MKRRELSADALRLIVRIGGSVEQCVLDRARKISSARHGGDRPAALSVRDVSDSLQALLAEEALGLRSVLDEEVAELRKPRQAG